MAPGGQGLQPARSPVCLDAVFDEAVTRYFRPLTHTRELGLAI